MCSRSVQAALSDHLSSATQLEATIYLAEWQRQRDKPPAERVVGIDPGALAYEATLDLVASAMREPR